MAIIIHNRVHQPTLNRDLMQTRLNILAASKIYKFIRFSTFNDITKLKNTCLSD